MDGLLTAFSLVAVLVVVLGAWRAWVSADRADRAALEASKALTETSGIRTRLATVEDGLLALTKQHQRLSGKFHATAAVRAPEPPIVHYDEDQLDLDLDRLDPELAAQLELQRRPPASPGKRTNGGNS